MLVVVSRLPKAWRRRETVEHLQEFLERFLDALLLCCYDIVSERKKMITVPMLNVALTRMGWSLSMSRIPLPNERDYSVTWLCVQTSTAKSKIHVDKSARAAIRDVTQRMVEAIVEHAEPFQQRVGSSPKQVVHMLRQKISASPWPTK